MPDSLGPLTIGPREIWDELSRLRSAVDRLVAQADTDGRLHSDTEERLRVIERDATSRSFPDHEARLRALERRSWPLPSLAALIAVASLVMTLLDKL